MAIRKGNNPTSIQLVEEEDYAYIEARNGLLKEVCNKISSVPPLQLVQE